MKICQKYANMVEIMPSGRLNKPFGEVPSNDDRFNSFMKDIETLSVPVLDMMLAHMVRSGTFHPWYNEYAIAVQNGISSLILERTVLK